MVEAGGDEAGGDEGDVGDKEKQSAAGGSGLDGRVVELVHGRGGGGDLGKPADDGDLQRRGANAGSHKQHGAREADGGELRRGDKGVQGLDVGAADESPHDERDHRGDEEVPGGGDGVEAVAEAADLEGGAIRHGFGEPTQNGADGIGDCAPGDADDHCEDGDEGGEGERDDAGVDEDGAVGQVVRREDESAGEDDGGGAEVEHALDGVDGELGADGKVEALGDQGRADDVGEAAKEGDRGEADELRSHQEERRNTLCCGDEDRPAQRAKPEGGIDEGNADGDVDPGNVAKLLPEDRPVEMDLVAVDVDEGGQYEGDDEHGNALAVFHSGLRCGWAGRWLARIRH